MINEKEKEKVVALQKKDQEINMVKIKENYLPK